MTSIRKGNKRRRYAALTHTQKMLRATDAVRERNLWLTRAQARVFIRRLLQKV